MYILTYLRNKEKGKRYLVTVTYQISPDKVGKREEYGQFVTKKLKILPEIG